MNIEQLLKIGKDCIILGKHPDNKKPYSHGKGRITNAWTTGEVAGSLIGFEFSESKTGAGYIWPAIDKWKEIPWGYSEEHMGYVKHHLVGYYTNAFGQEGYVKIIPMQ